MKISLIAAMTKDRVIGINNNLPWHLPEDFRHFKATTLNKPIIMGRKTFESLGNKPLPKRKNIVLTKSEKLNSLTNINKNLIFANNIQDALKACNNAPEVMIIGGSNIYGQFLSRADRLYLSIIDTSYSGDAYFPDYTKFNWKLIKEEPKNGFKIVILDRIKI